VLRLTDSIHTYANKVARPPTATLDPQHSVDSVPIAVAPCGRLAYKHLVDARIPP
jgi:hypothetical protein